MDQSIEKLNAAYRRAIEQVPAYRELLSEAGVRVEALRSMEDVSRLPVLEKRNTFQRFPLEQLCVGGELGKLGTVLTSSGHSGIFAFGLTEADMVPRITQWIDALLDELFSVRSRRTLLINCLPMGVKVPTEVCTLAETSVRPDMAVGLVKAFGRHFEQIVLIGETAFIKHTLELGGRSGVRWGDHRVHVIVGEEPLAENGRQYLRRLLEHQTAANSGCHVISSMGVAELGLNLFFEAPPHDLLVRLRQLLHRDSSLREALLGSCDAVPSLFTFDPERIFVEVEPDGSMLVSTVTLAEKIPLLRYRTGDKAKFISIPASLRGRLEENGVTCVGLDQIPILAVFGRGDHVVASGRRVTPEAVKEGVYSDPELVPLTTANFRLTSDGQRAHLRLQLERKVEPSAALEQSFTQAVERYVNAPILLQCVRYEEFVEGLAVDYERKFSYLRS